MPQGEKILFVEDDPNIIDVLEIHLKDLGYNVDRAGDGEMGLNKAQSNQYALVILDLMLPKLGGLEVCQKIRANNKSLPILMLTARNEEMDKVLGLEFGADDYITKPFNIDILKARVKSVINRSQKNLNILKARDITYTSSQKKFSIDGTDINLTHLEHDLLLEFMKNIDILLSRDILLENVWEDNMDVKSKTVNVAIKRLKEKIDPTGEKEYIKSVRGEGYIFHKGS